MSTLSCRLKDPSRRGLGLLLCLVALWVLLGVRSASAACEPAIPVSDDSVTCSGEINNPFAAPPDVTNLSLTVEPGAIFSLFPTPGDNITLNEISSVTNQGTVSATNENAAAIRMGAGLDAPNPSTVFNESGGEINAEATGSRGVVLDSSSQYVNEIDARLSVSGDQAIGVLAESTASDVRIFNRSGATITISGDNAVGLQGDGDGSYIQNSGTIEVSGPGAVAIAVKSFDPSAADALPRNVFNGADPSVPGSAGQIISTVADAGPLIRLEGNPDERINRVRNDVGGRLEANLDEVVNPNRAIALQGSEGVDELVNAGDIQGRINFGGDDDVFTAVAGSTVVDLLPLGSTAATIDGGEGDDEIRLTNASTNVESFDPGLTTNFEQLVVEGLWSLSNSTSPELAVRIDPGGALDLTEATEIQSDFSFQAAAPGAAPGELKVLINDETIARAQQLLVGGNADLAGGALELSVDNRFSGTEDIIIVRAQGGLSGEFDQVETPTEAEGLTIDDIVYAPSDGLATLTLSATPFSANQQAISDYIDQILASPQTPAELNAVIQDVDALSFGAYRQALNQISPEAYDAQTTATFELANQYAQIMLERPRYCASDARQRRIDPGTGQVCPKRGVEPWVAVYGQLGDRTGQGDHISYHDQGFGLVFGLDHRINADWILGASLGGAYDALTVVDIGKGRIRTMDVGLYTGYQGDRLRVEGLLSYGYGWQSQSRELSVVGLAATARSDWNSNRISGRIQGEYLFDVDGWKLGPMASLDYMALLQEATTETGASPLNLQIDKRDNQLVTVRAGFALTTTLNKTGYWTDFLESADGAWRPSLSVQWRQLVTDYDRSITARFAEEPQSVGSMTVQGQAPRMGFEISTGLDWTPEKADRLTFGLHYDVFVWKDVVVQDLNASIRIGF